MNTLNLLKSTALTTAMIISLGSTAVLANNYMNERQTNSQGMQQEKGQMFSQFDRDNDSRLNNNEFATYTFYTLDYDDDNMISDEEWDTYTNTWYEPIDLEYDDSVAFTTYDANDNGYIEANEYASAYDTDLYSSWDMDNDGFIEVAEYNDLTTTYYNYDSNNVYVW